MQRVASPSRWVCKQKARRSEKRIANGDSGGATGSDEESNVKKRGQRGGRRTGGRRDCGVEGGII